MDGHNETHTRGTILFVDDERRVLTSMRAMFRRDHEVLLANSGQEALALLRDDVDVIV
jgi:serine/threonine-protein kinase